jgi:hypothetical protein
MFTWNVTGAADTKAAEASKTAATLQILLTIIFIGSPPDKTQNRARRAHNENTPVIQIVMTGKYTTQFHPGNSQMGSLTQRSSRIDQRDRKEHREDKLGMQEVRRAGGVSGNDNSFEAAQIGAFHLPSLFPAFLIINVFLRFPASAGRTSGSIH